MKIYWFLFWLVFAPLSLTAKVPGNCHLVSKSENSTWSFFERLPEPLLTHIMSFSRVCQLSLSAVNHNVQSLTHEIVAAEISRFIPSFLPSSNHRSFNSAFYAFFLDELQRLFPQALRAAVAQEDLLALVHLLSHQKNDEKMKRAAQHMRSCLGLSSNNSNFKEIVGFYSMSAFKNSLPLTAEFLLANGHLTQMNYYRNACIYSRSAMRQVFLKKALSFDHPVELLQTVFATDFALMLLPELDPTSKRDIFMFAADRINDLKPVSVEFVLELAKFPDALNRALCNCKDPNWLHCLLASPSAAEIEATGNVLWSKMRALIFMDSFDATDFSSDNASMIAKLVFFLPFMNLDKKCHFQAFGHFVANEDLDFSLPINIDSNMLFFCANSHPQYLLSFLKHSHTLPPLWMDGCFLAKSHTLTQDVLTALAPRLRLIDFLGFENFDQWKILTPFFHNLDITESFVVYLGDSLHDFRAASRSFPLSLRDALEWPILHLAVAVNNLLAFEAILGHPGFKVEWLSATVNGISLEQLIDTCDRAEMESLTFSTGISYDFLKALEKYLKSRNLVLI